MREKDKRITWKKAVSLGIMLGIICSFIFNTSSVLAAQKTYAVVAKTVRSDKITYRKAVVGNELFGVEDWGNSVGIGKLKSVKYAKNCKFYLMGRKNVLKKRKVTKKQFLNYYNSKIRIREEGLYKTPGYCKGIKYYSGTRYDITIKNGKCIKIVEIYQC